MIRRKKRLSIISSAVNSFNVVLIMYKIVNQAKISSQSDDADILGEGRWHSIYVSREKKKAS